MPERIGILIGCIILSGNNFDRSQPIFAVERKTDRRNRRRARRTRDIGRATRPDLRDYLNGFFGKPVSKTANINDGQDHEDDRQGNSVLCHVTQWTLRGGSYSSHRAVFWPGTRNQPFIDAIRTNREKEINMNMRDVENFSAKSARAFT